MSFLPAISTKAAKAIRKTIREWRMASTRNNQRLEDLARFTNPVVRGWLNYYGRFYRSKCVQVLRHFNEALARWARRKFKRFKRRERASMHWLGRIARRDPQLFVLWQPAYVRRLEGRSRMKRELHVRFCEGGGVRFPSATRRNIYVRSHRAGERVMASVSRFLTQKLRLKVNEAKSAVARPEERKFLGFSIANDGSERRIAPTALAKFKAQIRDMTRRTRGISLPQMVKDLAPYLLGWRGYFGFCQTPRVLTNLEAWIRRRLRLYLWRQWQNGPNRFKELRRRGVPKFHAAVAAGSPTGFWRMSGHPAVQQALRNPYFDGLGLPRLYVPAQA